MKLSCFKCCRSSPAWQYNYTEPLLSILIEQEDRELQSEAEVCRRDNMRPSLPSSLPPSLLHAPLGLLAALQNSARGHSGNHLFPAEHRAWGMQHAGSEAHKFARKGGCLPMHCMLWNIALPYTPPHLNSCLWCCALNRRNEVLQKTTATK